MDNQGSLKSNVLVFPYPAQAHVNSMLKLAELLCHGGLAVTFLMTEDNHRRLVRHSNVQSRFARYPGFRFETIPDGLPEDATRSVFDTVMELFHSFRVNAKPLLREVLTAANRGTNPEKPITCVIANALLMSFAQDVAQEFGIPAICYRSCVSYFWISFCVPKLIETGELPFIGNNLEVPVPKESVPGMDHYLRFCDLPSFCRMGDLANPEFQVNENKKVTKAQALILNTFEELEGPILAQARSVCPKIYTIGPLHEHLKNRVTSSIVSNSLWEEDVSCMTWLDVQPPRSVIYVSFGSVTTVTEDQLVEFSHGLINSGKRFLWVIRPYSVAGKDGENQIREDLLKGASGRGYIVGWAPQEEVLGHQAIGGFINHGGWNSIMESIVKGVPMICWPQFADQPTNSRLVEEVWKIGLDMKDTCDRVIIEKMVRDLMEERREEFMQSADRMAKLAKEAISEAGPSYCSLDHLIEDIKSMSA